MIIKKIFKKILQLLSFVYSLVNLLILILKVDFKNRTVFLQPEGGFAHTILSPEVLKRIYKKSTWCIIFGYEIRRHNYLTKNLYEGHFFG